MHEMIEQFKYNFDTQGKKKFLFVVFFIYVSVTKSRP